MNKGTCKELFGVFLRIGAFTFGGGYAMIPLIRREVVEEKKWITENEIFDIISIAESTPGPLAINAATFVGNRMCGLKGALAATLGVVLPSFMVILVISQLLLQIEHFQIVKSAFQGIRAGVLVLIGNALISLFCQTKKNPFTYVVMMLVFVLAYLLKLNTMIILIFSALSGLVWNYCQIKRADK